MLEKVGFSNRGGKDNQRNFLHPSRVEITISGKPGNDVLKYQEKEVKLKIVEVKK